MIPNLSAVDALYYSQVLDGMLIPILIAITLFLANDKCIMGDYTSSRWSNFFALFAFVATVTLVGVTIWKWFNTM
ncbi:hypothetical protein [Nitratiruptor sp. YY09-18]|uniref:hypothetical protein n=1 Tax=Nitratiruptor sp. YY09-18 TaxID=2724901 RepID=UPI001916413C|nr:hypothetical protein [Nitratiruptor sp. YY09-18]BCD67857.1 hypothetical protein NitYY0918_C0764 [Nitratiruptor sp. YY09-18]